MLEGIEIIPYLCIRERDGNWCLSSPLRKAVNEGKEANSFLCEAGGKMQRLSDRGLKEIS